MKQTSGNQSIEAALQAEENAMTKSLTPAQRAAREAARTKFQQKLLAQKVTGPSKRKFN